MLNFCRFHSYCVDLTPDQVTNMDKYMCSSCAPENHKRASAPSHKTPDIKVMMCKILVVLCTCSAPSCAVCVLIPILKLKEKIKV